MRTLDNKLTEPNNLKPETMFSDQHKDPLNFVHEGGVTARNQNASVQILDSYGLRPILYTANPIDVLLLSDNKESADVVVSLLLRATSDASLTEKLYSLAYNLGATVYHCKQLAKSYSAALSEFLKIVPDRDSDSAYYCLQASPYYEFDALLSAARRTYDKLGQVAWHKFAEHKGGMPDNFEQILEKLKGLPPNLRDQFLSSWNFVGRELKYYRDCTQHHTAVDIGMCNMAMSKLKDIWVASAMIPDNPEVKSRFKLSYNDRRDALSYGWSVTSEVSKLAQAINSAV